MENTWDNLYLNNKHHSIWPWSDVITEFKKMGLTKCSVLELGCGMGANIPFIIAENHKYYGIDGSKTAVDYIKEKYPAIAKNIEVGDFTKEIPFDRNFEIIFDRASVTHNKIKNIHDLMENLTKKICVDGFFIGIDWFSKSHSDYNIEMEIERGTIQNIETKQFKDVGIIHFFDAQEIINLFSAHNFKILKLEEKMIHEISKENPKRVRASFNFVAKKNA